MNKDVAVSDDRTIGSSSALVIEEDFVCSRNSPQAGNFADDDVAVDRGKNFLNAHSELPRIAMVSTHGYVAAHPPLGAVDTGGQVVYVLELSKKLAELGYEVDIWTRQFEEQPQLEFVSERVRIVRVPCGGDEFLPKEYLSQAIDEWSANALQFIADHGLNYAFISSHYWDAGLAGQRLSCALDAPHVHTPHSLGLWKKLQMESDYPGNAEKFESQYNFGERVRQERQLYKSADLIVATSPQQVDILSQDYEIPVESCPMIPPGYDDNRFSAIRAGRRRTLRRQFNFTGKVVLALGRLARNKGYDLLIQGFAVLAARESDARLHLAVGGTSMTELEQTILGELHRLVEKLELDGKVEFGTFIPDEELADYYRAADLFVLSSRYEPFGMTAIEAMASGTPTVVTTHGGLCRTLCFGQDAMFADPLDSADLGIAMCQVFRHKELRQRLSRQGAKKARQLFTWSGIAQQLIGRVSQLPNFSVTARELGVG